MTTQLGKKIRELRMAKDVSLRGFATKLGISPPYLSDIENGYRNPTEELLTKIAKELGAAHSDLEKLSGRITDDVRKLIKENPEAAVLMRKIAADKDPNMVLKKLLKEVQKK